MTVLAVMMLLMATQLCNAAFREWADTFTQQLEQEFLLTDSKLYAENVGYKNGVFVQSEIAHLWPTNLQLRVLTAAAAVDGETYIPKLRQFADSYHEHKVEFVDGVWRYNEYYDDNGGMLLALLEAYNVTSDPVYLERAKHTMEFMLTGEDPVQGGGLYQYAKDKEKKVTSATVQAVMGALMLCKLTGEVSYLNHAQRLFAWMRKTLQDTDGLFFSSVDAKNGKIERNKMARNAGYPIIANLLFYDIFQDKTYLDEAVRIAKAAEAKWIGSQGQLAHTARSAFKLIDGYLELYERTKDLHWLQVPRRALAYVHDNVADVNGHYATTWDEHPKETINSWELLDEAPVARAYWRLAKYDGVE